jgi:hypothetical protein
MIAEDKADRGPDRPVRCGITRYLPLVVTARYDQPRRLEVAGSIPLARSNEDEGLLCLQSFLHLLSKPDAAFLPVFTSGCWFVRAERSDTDWRSRSSLDLTTSR